MKRLLSVLVSLLVASVCMGQARSSQRFVVDEVVNYNDLKVGYTRHVLDCPAADANTFRLNNSLTLEYNRYVWRGVQVGVYAGARCYERHFADDTVVDPAFGTLLITRHEKESGVALLYGLNINYHFKALFNNNVTSWDAWVGAKVGGYTAHKTSLEYSAGVGGAYYFTPHWGIYLEALYGSPFLYEIEGAANGMHPQGRAGVTFQF